MPNLKKTDLMPAKLTPGIETKRVVVLAPEDLIDRVEMWRKQQDRIPSRSEAFRLLVEHALDSGFAQSPKS